MLQQNVSYEITGDSPRHGTKCNAAKHSREYLVVYMSQRSGLGRRFLAPQTQQVEGHVHFFLLLS